MDQQKLIDAITEQVMQRLIQAQAGSVSPGAQSVSATPKLQPAELAKYIDHTLLKPDAPTSGFDKLCEEAIQYGMKSVCVNSSRVPYVARKLQGTKVQVCAVVGFPLGAMSSRSKAFEARDAISEGAAELDMVLAVGHLKSKEYDYVLEDIRSVRRATRSNTVLKVIIETSMLSEEEKVIACELSKKAGADFVKTSTGFGGGGATVEDISLMRSVVGPEMGVKASGGVRDYDKALLMIGAGADRIGAATSVPIVTGVRGTGAGY
ncbi:MAG: deoxyribose-phosphate aldolase [Spirochaetota bacterium]